MVTPAPRSCAVIRRRNESSRRSHVSQESRYRLRYRNTCHICGGAVLEARFILYNHTGKICIYEGIKEKWPLNTHTYMVFYSPVCRSPDFSATTQSPRLSSLRRLFEQSRVPAVEQTSARGVSRLAGPAVTMANGGDQWAKQAAKALFGGEITRTNPPQLTDHAPKPARLSSVVVFS